MTPPYALRLGSRSEAGGVRLALLYHTTRFKQGAEDMTNELGKRIRARRKELEQ